MGGGRNLKYIRFMEPVRGDIPTKLFHGRYGHPVRFFIRRRKSSDQIRKGASPWNDEERRMSMGSEDLHQFRNRSDQASAQLYHQGVHTQK
jgi:hypothetical protein